jgi:hypothetical protein
LFFLVLLLGTAAFANPIQDCKEFLDQEVSLYEYFDRTKALGDAIYYGLIAFSESQTARDSRLMSDVHELFRKDFIGQEPPVSAQFWFEEALKEWKYSHTKFCYGCGLLTNSPSQVCLQRFRSYYPFLRYSQEVLRGLRSVQQGIGYDNKAYLRIVGSTLEKNFNSRKYAREDIEAFLIECEKIQEGSSGILISGFEEFGSATLFRVLLKSFGQIEIEKADGSAGRVRRSLEIRDEKLQKRLAHIFKHN